ncbi:hypothetical protein ACFL45_07650 [Candidatus Neomarinimicrobiota bacterium]
MDLKDKLNLLWKYLFLAAVIVFGILLVCRRPGYCRDDDHFKSLGYVHQMGMPHQGMMDPGKIRVEKKVIDGDTTVVVWVDGKKIDHPKAFLKMHGEDSDRKDHCMGCGGMHGPGMDHANCARMHDNNDDDDDPDDDD